MQLGAKRAVDARATLLLGRGWCKTQNAHEARPWPSFRGQKAVSHVAWTQIPSTVLPPGQMAKCENCDSVHWQRQQSSVQVREPETGVEKVKRKWLQRTGPQVLIHFHKLMLLLLWRRTWWKSLQKKGVCTVFKNEIPSATNFRLRRPKSRHLHFSYYTCSRKGIFDSKVCLYNSTNCNLVDYPSPNSRCSRKVLSFGRWDRSV